MSASPIARQITHSQAIPSRRMLISDPAQMPDVYSSTPGGTLYSTTPGGTKIVYERTFLMTLRESPISKTPPKISLPSGMTRGNGNSPPRTFSTVPTSLNRKMRAGSIDEGADTFSLEL